MRVLLLLALVGLNAFAHAQNNIKDADTNILSVQNLSDITVVGKYSRSDIQSMPEIVGTSIYAGKKSSLVVVGNVKGNVANNQMRQVLAKIPGVHIWESDPSGIQIGIAARGLSPNRSWEFNIRQNGYDIAADPYGYPEAYYNPQLQGVQRIEIIRGHGSLQYGPQFGGMVNYILKNGSDIEKKIQWENTATIGSNKMLSVFSALGGKSKKWHYYSFYDRRSGDGWRKNSRFTTDAGFVTITYKPNEKISLAAECMLSHINSQQPGGLTDRQFNEDAQQSLRARNWMDIIWMTPALLFDYQINNRTRLQSKAFGTIGNRNSVGFMASINIPDSLNAADGSYQSRTLNADQYRNKGIETRFITEYQIGTSKQTLSAGFRMYSGNTFRKANGTGSKGAEYDMTTMSPYLQQFDFHSTNVAVFAEQIIKFGKRIIIIPGIRYEWLEGKASGINGFDAGGAAMKIQDITRKRSFVLAGIGAEYHFDKPLECYVNITQAYRPIQFANLQAPPGTDVVDPGLRDARGYNADLGVRGSLNNAIKFDVSIFLLQYNHRIGTIIPPGQSYRLITNVGNSTSKGLECYAGYDLAKIFNLKPDYQLSFFHTYSFTDARYATNHLLANTRGKRVENAPQHILRAGLTTGYKMWNLTLQHNLVSDAFSDANNTIESSANGQTGLIPSYQLTDITLSIEFKRVLKMNAGVTNLFDKRYFTRRAGGYPGPGVLPGDGRMGFVMLGFRI